MKEAKYDAHDFEQFSKVAFASLEKNQLEKSLFSATELQRLHASDRAIVSPVCAILGGFLAQDIIKVLSRVGRPIVNVFIFSAEDSVGREFLTTATGSLSLDRNIPVPTPNGTTCLL